MSSVYDDLLTHLRTELAAIAGTYTFPGNQTTPAFRFDKGQVQPQPNVAGLEIVVRQGDVDAPAAVLNGSWVHGFSGTVHLFEHDTSKTANVHQPVAIAAMMKFAKTTPSFEVRTNEIVGVPPQPELNALSEVRIPFRLYEYRQ
ncbi:MAG: hypothetical protein AAFX78_04975 [Cyanobacteria bacterium J06638_20]